MKAFVVSRYGKADGVRAVDLPEPELRDDDVLVQIHAASINPLDLTNEFISKPRLAG